MKKVNVQIGPWAVECLPDDGARLSVLQYRGVDLQTRAPEAFRRPATLPNKPYETRPVYGYDDCFPSVAPCQYPQADWDVPDHGELCWLPWKVQAVGNTLDCQVESRLLPVHFGRKMTFSDDRLVWDFELVNLSDRELPWQHVMHPLMPARDIVGLQLPEFTSPLRESGRQRQDITTAQQLAKYLLAYRPGKTTEVTVNGIAQGRFGVDLSRGCTWTWFSTRNFCPR